MADENKPKVLQFHEMELDDRILKAIAKLGWQDPTLIQEKAIPLLLEGKDVLVRARTGSGKTAAFAIPTIQKILHTKQTARKQEIKALILAPSKELCTQINSVIKTLTLKCSREVRSIDISPHEELNVQRPLLVEKPDIVVSTPARALLHLKAGNMALSTYLELLVIDEADLVFSFGYEQEVKELMTYLPKIYQAILASATLSEDVKTLKSLVLHNPVILKLEEPDLAPTSQLKHYHLMAEEMDKATILYALLKLHLIRGKTIIFVNTVDKCYKLIYHKYKQKLLKLNVLSTNTFKIIYTALTVLMKLKEWIIQFEEVSQISYSISQAANSTGRIKLYMEQFGIPTCVLNSELPAKVRCHSVNQFNQGVYDIIIASDEKSLEQPSEAPRNEIKSKTSKRNKDKESGVSRGIDFQCVSNVINFDFPLDKQSYIHRAGRTARGNNEGSVLSFVSIKEKVLLEKVENHLKSAHNEDQIFRAYQFKLEEVEAFRYRAKDAWRAVTKIAIREARLKEIKQEIFNCQKLKTYFEDNPSDLQVLRHDKALHTVKIQQHLADVPDYIVPPTLKNITDITKSNSRKRQFRKTSESFNKYKMQQSNPLVSMKFDGFEKKKKKKK